METITLLLKEKINDWQYVLQHACWGGDIDIVNLIIENSVIMSPSYWSEGMYGAAKGGHLELIELMARKGAVGWGSALSGACYSGNRELIDIILSRMGVIGERQASKAMLNACLGGDIEIVKRMASLGGNDNTGQGLWAACRKGHEEVAMYLIEGRPVRNWDMVFGYSCHSGNLSLVKTLFEKFRSKAVKHMGTGMYYACSKGRENIIQLLIDEGCVDWNNGLLGAMVQGARPPEGLDYKGGYREIAEMMINRGATNFVDALNKSIDGNSLELTKMMIDKIRLVQPDKMDDILHNALSRSFFGSREKLYQLLVSEGA